MADKSLLGDKIQRMKALAKLEKEEVARPALHAKVIETQRQRYWAQVRNDLDTCFHELAGAYPNQEDMHLHVDDGGDDHRITVRGPEGCITVTLGDGGIAAAPCGASGATGGESFPFRVIESGDGGADRLVVMLPGNVPADSDRLTVYVVSMVLPAG